MKSMLRQPGPLVAIVLVMVLFTPPVWAIEQSFASLSLEELMDISITSASKREESIYEAPSIMEVITAQDIRRLGANNLLDVLDRATSVQGIGSTFYPENVVSLRGQSMQHENNHVLILINGRPFRDSVTQGNVASLLAGFPIDLIDSIEIIRGPGSVLYGSSAFSGVINIKTKSVDDLDSVGISASYGSFSSLGFDGHVALGTEERGLLVGIKSLDSDGWDMTFTDQNRTSNTFKTKDNDVATVLTAHYKNLSVNGFFGQTKQNALQSTGLYPVYAIERKNGLLDIGYEHGVGNGWTAKYNLTYNQLDFVDGRISSEDLLGEVTLGGAVGDRTQLLFGGTYEHHSARFQSNPKLTKQLSTIYAQADLQVLDWLKLTGGFQFNKDPDIESGFSPRLAAIGQFASGWGFKLLYGEAFRTATFVERSIVAPGIINGNPDLLPEEIATAEAQLFYRTSRYSAAVTYYHSTMTDLITRVGFPIEFENLGEIVFNGVEAEGKLLGDSFSLACSVSYQTNEDENGMEDTTFTPNLMAKLSATYDVRDGFTLGLADSFFGEPTQLRELVPGVPEVNPEPQSYHLVTLNAMLDLNALTGKQGGTSWKLQLFINNLLDEEINFPDINASHVNSFPIRSGRGVYARVSVGF